MRPSGRRRLSRPRTFRQAGWLVGLGAAVAAVVFVAGFARLRIWPAIVHHPYFQLHSVRIVCNSPSAEPSQLASRAGLFEGTSLWQVDVGRARRALEALAWVEKARVSRRFPDRVSIEVSRREPVAATWLPGRGAYLIDAGGVLYREGGGLSYADVPYLTGWQRAASRGGRIVRLERAMELAEKAAKRGLVVSQVDVEPVGVFWLFTEDPPVGVRLGAQFNADRALDRLQLVLSNLPQAGAGIEEIDLSYRDRAVIRVEHRRFRQVLSALAEAVGARPREGRRHG